MSTEVRPITVDDIPFVLGCIQELAEFEKLTHQLDCDETRFAKHLFGERPMVEGLIADFHGEPAATPCSFIIIQRFVRSPESG